MVQAPYKDAPRSDPGEEVLGMSYWKEIPLKGQTQSLLERSFLTVTLGTSGDPPGGAGICGWGSVTDLSFLQL